MVPNEIQLAKLVNSEDPEEVFKEVSHLVGLFSESLDLIPLRKVLGDVQKLFAGEMPGYRESNTQYHDLNHTLDALLAMVRLIHGASIIGKTISPANIRLGLIATLLHDSGYLQNEEDQTGTGAKHTLIHIRRSIDFLEKYFRENGFTLEETENAKGMLLCTGLSTRIDDLQLRSGEIQLLGRMMGAADLLGQMSDRLYLEKLLFLFYEFLEGSVAGFDSEMDLLKKTLAFFEATKMRLSGELGGVDQYMIHHFRVRWGIDKDLYADAIEKNIAYLHFIVEKHEYDYRQFLRRGGIIRNLADRGM